MGVLGAFSLDSPTGEDPKNLLDFAYSAIYAHQSYFTQYTPPRESSMVSIKKLAKKLQEKTLADLSAPPQGKFTLGFFRNPDTWVCR